MAPAPPRPQPCFDPACIHNAAACRARGCFSLARFPECEPDKGLHVEKIVCGKHKASGSFLLEDAPTSRDGEWRYCCFCRDVRPIARFPNRAAAMCEPKYHVNKQPAKPPQPAPLDSSWLRKRAKRPLSRVDWAPGDLLDPEADPSQAQWDTSSSSQREGTSAIPTICKGVLDLSERGLTQWPADEVARAGAGGTVTSLDVYGNRLESIPDQLASLASLTSLSLARNGLRSVPALPPSLRRLDLSANCLQGLPPFSLPSLLELVASANALRGLPTSLARHTGLVKLFLSGNPLVEIPPPVFELASLECLAVAGARLAAVPPAIGRLARLRELILGSNRIEELPNALYELTALERLDLSSNRLASVTWRVGRLARLRELDLSRNRIEWLPAALGALPRLSENGFRCESNPLGRLPPEARDSGPAALRFLRDGRPPPPPLLGSPLRPAASPAPEGLPREAWPPQERPPPSLMDLANRRSVAQAEAAAEDAQAAAHAAHSAVARTLPFSEIRVRLPPEQHAASGRDASARPPPPARWPLELDTRMYGRVCLKPP